MTETDKVDMLMRPRYKVVGLYPFSSYYFALNEVIELTEFDGREHLSKEQNEWYVVKQSKYNKELVSSEPMLPMTMHESAFNLYPHLFKRLSWWEDRKPEEMPGYVKVSGGGLDTSFGRASNWHKYKIGDDENFGAYVDGRLCGVHVLTPATKSEYLAYINSPTPAQ